MQPCGIWNSCYEQDIAIVRTRLQWGLLAAFLILLSVFPFFSSSYLLDVVSFSAIAIIAVSGLNILTGYCGQISLGQAAFTAVGAYTSAILSTKLGLSFWLCLPCAGLCAGTIGMLFGLPSLRVKGFYLALATLAAQFIVTWVLVHFHDLTGGVNGIDAKAPTIGTMVFRSSGEMYYIVMGITCIMVFFAKNIVRTRVGRAFVAIRDNDIAAEVLGIHVYGYKLLAFFICSFYAGIAGALMTHYMRFTCPDFFRLTDSIWYLGMAIVGGLGSILGSILGTVFIKLLQELVVRGGPILTAVLPLPGLTVATASAALIGLVIILFLIFEPRGLAHRWEILKSSYRLWPFSY